MEKKRERHFIYKGLVLIMALFVALLILPQRFFSSTQANITVVKPFLLKACLLSFTLNSSLTALLVPHTETLPTRFYQIPTTFSSLFNPFPDLTLGQTKWILAWICLFAERGISSAVFCCGQYWVWSSHSRPAGLSKVEEIASNLLLSQQDIDNSFFFYPAWS